MIPSDWMQFYEKRLKYSYWVRVDENELRYQPLLI